MSEELSSEEIAALLASGSEEMSIEKTKVKSFDVLHFIADNAGLSMVEAIEKAYNIGVAEQKAVLGKIRAEIEQFAEKPNFGDLSLGASCGARKSIEIMDKYNVESREQE